MNRVLRLPPAPFEQPELRWHMPDDVITWDNIRPTDAARVVSDRSPYQQGRDDERAAVLAWLRREAEQWPTHSMFWDEATRAADAIEAGEHLAVRQENPPEGAE